MMLILCTFETFEKKNIIEARLGDYIREQRLIKVRGGHETIKFKIKKRRMHITR